ncbi:MAG: hypothetical protein ACRDK9_08050 [Solirubrobacterales bacterium]
MTETPERVARVAARVLELAERWEPPTFAHVPNADAALFLCAVDHRSGYRGRYLVDGEGPFEGSALLWAVALQAGRRQSGLLTAARLADASERDVAELFRIGGETVADPGRRAELWRDLATGLARDYEGAADALLAACERRLGGRAGLLDRLAMFAAYADPLAKKSQLFAKICDRRGWFSPTDPEHWQVSADNVLMRLALRSGLVEPGEREEVRARTRDAFADVAEAAGMSPPLLDDLLWELGRDDPDLLGTEGGALQEPPREPESTWY